MSGKEWDQLAEVAYPYGESEPPLTDEVLLSDLELKPRQQFLCLFDFGDELCHDVEVLDVLPAGGAGDFARIAEVDGKAPPQYLNWREDEDEGHEDEYRRS